MTRLGHLLHFGQLFKACGNNYFAQIAHILGNFCEGFKIFHFSSGIIFGQLLQSFGDFYWSHWPQMRLENWFELQITLSEVKLKNFFALLYLPRTSGLQLCK